MHTRSTVVVDKPYEVWSSYVNILMVFSRCGPKLQKYQILFKFNSLSLINNCSLAIDCSVHILLLVIITVLVNVQLILYSQNWKNVIGLQYW